MREQDRIGRRTFLTHQLFLSVPFTPYPNPEHDPAKANKPDRLKLCSLPHFSFPRASIELVEAEVSELETRLEKVTRDQIKMRGVEPGRKLDVENES